MQQAKALSQYRCHRPLWCRASSSMTASAFSRFQRRPRPLIRSVVTPHIDSIGPLPTSQPCWSQRSYHLPPLGHIVDQTIRHAPLATAKFPTPVQQLLEHRLIPYVPGQMQHRMDPFFGPLLAQRRLARLAHVFTEVVKVQHHLIQRQNPCRLSFHHTLPLPTALLKKRAHPRRSGDRRSGVGRREILRRWAACIPHYVAAGRFVVLNCLGGYSCPHDAACVG